MNNQRRLAVVLLLAVSFVCAVHAQTTASKFELPKNLPRILNKLQTHLDQARTTAKFPGAQVGFTWIDTEASNTHYSGSVASGMSDIEHNVPLKTSDRLLAGSNGKTFVAVVAGKPMATTARFQVTSPKCVTTPSFISPSR